MSTERQQRSFVDPAVIAQLGALPLLSRKPMLGSVSGRHASPHRGASVEFAEYRCDRRIGLCTERWPLSGEARRQQQRGDQNNGDGTGETHKTCERT